MGQDPSLTYTAALYNATAGSQTLAGPEIRARFNPFQAWDYDVTGAPDPDRFSLLETAVHEILHGLGFASHYQPSGVFYGGTGLPMPYDEFLVLSDRTGDEANATFTPLSDLATPADIAAALISGRLYSNAPEAMAVNPAGPGLPVRLYAPSPHEPGSSVAHVDQATYEPFGETMTPQATPGNIKPIGVSEMSAAFLRDIGYAVPTSPDTRVLSTGPFWGTLFQTDTDPFSVPTSVDLSEPLATDDGTTTLAEIDDVFAAAGDSDVPPIELQLADGQVRTIGLGASDRIDLDEILRAFELDEGGTPIVRARFVEGALIVEDFTDPVPGGKLALSHTASHRIERFLPAATARADSNLLVFENFLPPLPRYDVARLRPTTRLTDLLSGVEETQILGRSHSARLELIDGTTRDVSTGVLTTTSTLQDLIDVLNTDDGGVPRTVAHLPTYDDRIVVHDRVGVTAPQRFDDFVPPGALTKVPLQLVDTTPGVGIFDLLFASHVDDSPNRDGDAFLHSDSLATRRFNRIETPRERVFYVDELTEVSPRTPLATIIDRQLLRSDPTVDQSMRVRLRDGTVAEFTLPGDARTYSLASATEQLKSFDPGGNLRAEIELRDGKWVVIDRTGGTLNEMAWVSADPLFETIFTVFRSEAGPTERFSDSLSQSVFSRLAGDVSISTFIESGLYQDAAGTVRGTLVSNAATNPRVTAPIEISFRDGTTETIPGFPWGGSNLLQLIDRFNIDSGVGQRMEAWVEDDAIHFRDRTTPAADANGSPHIFSVRYAPAGDGGLQLSRLIPFGSDADGDGQLHGPRLLPPLPSADASELAVSPLSLQSSLGDVFGTDSDLFGGNPIELAFDAGDAVNPVAVPNTQIGPFAATDAVHDLLLALTVPDPANAGSNLLSANLVGERIVVSHSGGPTFGLPASLQLGDGASANSRALRGIIAEHFDSDNDGRFLGTPLIASLPEPVIRPDTRLDQLFLGNEFDRRVAGGSVVPITVTLSDGTTETIAVDHRAGMTMTQYLDQYEIVRDDRTLMAASLQIVRQPTGRDRYRPVIRDLTTAESSTPLSLRIDYESEPPQAASIPLELGLIGVDGMRSGRVAGITLTPARGQGLSSRVRVVTPPSLSATFSAVASDINASARVGELLGAEIRDGSGSLYGSIALSVPMPEGRDHLTLGDLADAIVNPWDSLQLELDADLEFGGEVIVDVAGLNDAPGGPGLVPRLDLVWDDILIADPAVRLQPENLQITTENLDNLFDFSDVSMQDVIRLIGEDIHFTTSLVSLEAAVIGGRVAFDRDGLRFDGGSDSTEPVDWGITAGNWPGGFRPLTDVGPQDFEADFGFQQGAQIGVDLPLEILGQSTQLQLQWADLESFSFEVLPPNVPITTQTGNTLAVPDIAASIENLSLGDGIAALAAGLQGLFESLESRLGDEFLGIDVPLLGEALDDAVRFVDRFVAPLADAFTQGFADSPELGEEVAAAIFEVLGPGSNGSGLDVIDDRNGDGNITSEDVGIITYAGNDRAIGFALALDLGSIFENLPIELDLGGRGIGLEIDGDVVLEAGLQLDVGIGIDLDAGPFVEFFDGTDFAFRYFAAIDDLVAEGRFGPLALTVSTIDAAALDPARRQASRIDPDDPSTEAVNAVRGSFGIDFPVGVYTLSNLDDAIAGAAVQSEFVGSLHAHFDTGLNTSIEGLPTLVADLHLHFDAATGSLQQTLDSISSPRVELANVGLDLGSFVTDVIAPILEPVQDFLEPLQPTIEKLTEPIPVLSDIIGETTFVDLIALFGQGGETAVKFVNAILTINDAIANLPVSADGLILPLGNFSVVTGADGQAVPVQDGGSSGQGLDEFLSSGDAAGGAADFLNNLPRNSGGASSGGQVTREKGKFSFPILENPASAVGLLFGSDVDLVKFQAPTLEAEFAFNVGIPIFPAFEITFGGRFNAIIDFAFGYDTLGMRQFAESGRATDLLNGFYLDDYREVGVDANGTPIFEEQPELTFAFAVTAGGELDLAVAKAGVQIELGAQLLLDLNDPDGDTKVRLDELAANIQLGTAPALGPLWIFDASGQLTVALNAYVKALGFRVNARLGPKVLVNYDFPRPEPADIVLGRVEEDGTLVLHVGPEAENRVGGDARDKPETVFVEYDEETGKTKVTGFGETDEYVGVTRLVADGGDGHDTILVDETFTRPVEIDGGYGNDEIQLGGGPGVVRGGWGNDVITGGSADDQIFGQGSSDPPEQEFNLGNGQTVTVVWSDDDLINGDEGDDVLIGGPGDDNLKGDEGNDRIVGGDGDDFINGGDGDDVLIGSDGDDVISGDGGDDVLYGDAEAGETPVPPMEGRDVLLGGDGADIIYGGALDDELFGGLGPDQLFGGDGNDLIVGAVTSRDDPNFEAIQPAFDTAVHTIDGGLGNDRIYGTAGPDSIVDAGGRNRIYTYEGDDTVVTGDGDDLIETGAGDDVVRAGGGRNEIRTGAGFDIVDSGTGSDLIDLRPLGAGGPISETAGGQITDLGGDNLIYTDDGHDIIDVLAGGSNFVDAGGGDNYVRTLGGGGDVIRTGAGNDQVEAGDGANEISTGGGDDSVTAGGGNDRVFLGAGDDVAVVGAGDDVVLAGMGDDFVDAGSGNDVVRGGDGDDVLVGGIGDDTLRGESGADVVWGGLMIYSRDELLSELVTPIGYDPQQSIVPFPAIVPAVVASGPLEGSLEDGSDVLLGGGGRDYLFGGGGDDRIEGGLGGGYLDGGRGDDLLLGTPGTDVIRGGDGDDRIEAGAGLDFSYGDGGDDFILGGSGVRVAGIDQTFGQVAFGGSGNDVLWAYAETTHSPAESRLNGERLDGGEGRDELLGNLRQDTLIGSGGDDRLLGDALAGPDYNENPLFRTTGGGDLILGGPGDDLLQGGGGDDVLWGGENVDELEGHAGEDRLYGGGGIDFLRLDVDPLYAFGGDVLDGHLGNAPDELTEDDFATDIVLINGTSGDDAITLAGDDEGQAVVFYNGRELPIELFDADGNSLVEQFQINGLAGDDVIRFAYSFDTTRLAERSRDWIGVLQGGAGNDTLVGTAGRDRIDGGRGSDIIRGLGGDDRLWGDSGEGAAGDVDRLYAGAGNDDLLGGVGVNYLYAWSEDPTSNRQHPSGPEYGVFGPDGNREDTGLNRMLGRDADDLLFAGTGLDFMYGGAGDDRLHDVDGERIEDFGVPESEQWLAYARESDAVWYYGGTERNDVITVDYVTEPGLLGEHHLITRLTENNGFFSFDAQVRLDFAATNADGSPVWDPSDLVYELQTLGDPDGDDARELVPRNDRLAADLLPPEGDYTAIVIDARAGDDQVRVGPTVQKTVWTSAGDGDDVVEYATGLPLLVDIPDTDPRNDRFGDPEDHTAAYDLGQVADSVYMERLTLDSPRDVDWYTFTIGDDPAGSLSRLVVDSLADNDEIELQIYVDQASYTVSPLSDSSEVQPDPATLDPRRRSRTEASVVDQGFSLDRRLYIRVRSLNASPTSYNLGIEFTGNTPLGVRREPLGMPSETFLRRDVLVGGNGNDVLRGGPGEDWVIGGPGDDILSGGADGSATDILVGGEGNDVFQVIPSAETSQPGSGDLTLADELEGGPGFDRVLFSGGDRDDAGNPIPDVVSLRYQPLLNRYELAAQVWDTANRLFLVSGDEFVLHTAAYRTRDIEATELSTHAGDDEIRLDAASYSIIDGEPVRVSGFQFRRPDGTAQTNETYGIAPGDRQVGGAAANFLIFGGAGNDRIVGSPYADRIDGGAGIDQMVGGGGNDTIDGGPGADLILGDEVQVDTTLFDRSEFGPGGVSNQTPLGAVPIDLSSGQAAGFTLHEGDLADWYLLRKPDAGGLAPGDIQVEFDNDLYQEIAEAAGTVLAEVTPARFDAESAKYLPTDGAADAYMIAVRNPLLNSIIAAERPGVDQLESGTSLNIQFYVHLEGTYRRTVSLQVDASAAGGVLAEDLNVALSDAGIGEDVRAYYDPVLDRLLLLSVRGKTVTVSQNTVFNLPWLGFLDGQTTGQTPAGLGKYRLLARTPVPAWVEQGPFPESVPFSYPTAERDPSFVVPPTPATLDDRDADLASSWIVEGSASGERLSDWRAIGDVNGDGRQDVMLVSSTRAYVLLGDVEIRGSVESIREVASYEIDLTTGNGTFIPLDSPVDLDGDGLSDLSFALVSPSGVLDVYALCGAVLTARDPSEVVFNRDARAFSVTTFASRIETVTVSDPDVPLDFAWLQYDADTIPDLAIFAREPVMRINGNALDMGYGVVKAGADLQGFFTGPGDGGATNLVSLGDQMEDGSVVGSTRYSGNYRILDATDELQMATADLTGDGRQELVLTMPRGWQVTIGDDGVADEVLSRTYVVTGNPKPSQVALNAMLGSPQVPAILEIAESDGGIRDPKDPASGMMGALNPTRPLRAADLDGDGIDELITVADVNHGTIVSAPINVFTASELLGSGDVARRQPQVSIRYTTDDSELLTADVATGDFDGDGVTDLVIGGRSGVTLFYDPIGGPTRRDLESEFGDSRPDVLVLPAPVGTGRFGGLAPIAVDINGDDIVDLSVGSPDRDSSGGFLDAGAVHVIAGAPRRIELPDEASISDLGNDSIRGIGDVVRASQGDVVVEGLLASGSATDWYRFRTVGDGRVGDRITLSPPADGPGQTAITRGANGIYSGGNAFDDVPLVKFDHSQTGVLEFDVSALLAELDDPSRIGSAALRVTGSSEAAGTFESLRQPDELTPVAATDGEPDRVFFVARSDQNGRALFVTDGTAEGTRVVFEQNPGPDSDQIQDLHAIGGNLVFTTVQWSGEEGPPSYELWITDGNDAKPVAEADEFVRGLQGTFTVFDDALYFLNDEKDPDLARVTFDQSGQARFEIVADLPAGDLFPPVQMAASPVGLFFARGSELWVSDGTSAGTERVRDFERIGMAYGERLFASLPGGVVFEADAGDGDGTQLFFSDGSEAGTAAIFDPSPGLSSNIHALTSVDEIVFFNEGSDLYRTDGTADGTKIARALADPKLDATGIVESLVVDGRHVAVFNRDDTEIVVTVTDSAGEEVSTRSMKADRRAVIDGVGQFQDQILIGYRIDDAAFQPDTDYVSMIDPRSGELTVLFSTLDDNYTGSFTDFAHVGGLTVFGGVRGDNQFGEELWTTDLTPAGTLPIAESLGGGSAAPVTLRFRGGRNDNVVTGTEDDGPVAFTASLTLDTVTSTKSLDLSQYLEELRALFGKGYRTITVTAEINEGEAMILPIGGDGSETALVIGRTGGVTGQLRDADGRLIANRFGTFDARNLSAGEYFLGISPADSGPTAATEYRATLEIPALGSAHRSTNDDRLSGGDGDDVIFGGPGRDRLFGESGADVLAGEPFELLGRDTGDVVRSSLVEHLYADSVSPRRFLDPAIVIGDSADDLGPGEQAIGSSTFATAIGDHLGVVVREQADGSFAFAKPLAASDLAEITEIDLSGRGLAELDGIEYLVGLRTLDLSDNELRSADLQPLRPAAAGAEGLQRIEHLRLDRNQLIGLGNLADLTTLRALSVADQSAAGVPRVTALAGLHSLSYLNVSGNGVVDLGPLANLPNLRLLDASGDVFAQQGLNQVDLRALTGTQAFDATIEFADVGWRVGEDEEATGGSYLVIDTQTYGDESTYVWGDLQLKPGSYEVYAAWNGDPSHHAGAVYSINGQEIGRADQRLPSRGRPFGDRELQRVGTYDADGGTFDVVFGADAGDGLLIADALVLRPVAGAAADNLVHLDLRGTSLSETRRDLLLGDFHARDGVLHVDPVTSPRWTGPSVVAVEAGRANLFDDLNTVFSDNGPDGLTFSAVADSSSVSLQIVGSQLQLNAGAPIERLVHVSITATNGEGLATTAVVPVAVGYGVVEGRVTDAAGKAVEGVRLLGDNVSGPEFHATTDAAGRYTLPVPGAGRVVPGDNSNVAALAPASTRDYDLRPGEVGTPIDFTLTRGLHFSLPGTAREGDAIPLVVETAGDGDYQWTVTDGPHEFTASTGATDSEFIPRDAGVYTVTVERRVDDRRYTMSRPIVVEEVTATVAEQQPVTITEGRLRETRTLVNDGGNDSWDVLIDFGNGEAVKLFGTESRDYTFDVAYPESGLYPVEVTVIDGDSTSRESFIVKVLETVPSFDWREAAAFVQGDEEGGIKLGIDDPSGRLNRYTWSFQIDWQDGTPPQDVSDLLELSGSPGHGRLDLTHVYASDGDYQPILTVVDDDGDSFEVTRPIVVENDLPDVTLDLPDTIVEDLSFEVVAVVEDADPTSVVWDFGDGSAPRSGTQATHAFSRSGQYTVTATVSDSDGAVTVATTTAVVTPVNDPPTVMPITTQRAYETVPFTVQVNAADEDDDTLSFTLRDAPDGMTVDALGFVRWTPGADQGPASYAFTVEVSDGQADVSVPISIDVIDTGAIRGRLFVDANANGDRDTDESPLAGVTVRLDAGNDGTIDQTLQTGVDGGFRFDALPLGTYRVIADAGDGFEFTTPSQSLIDLTVPEEIGLQAFGGLTDSDSDGLSNSEEQSSAAGLDANGDGVPDWLQGNVASLDVGQGFVTIVANAGATLSDLTVVDVQEGSPSDTRPDWGRLNFQIEGLATGGRGRVELFFSPDAGIDSIYRVDDDAPVDEVFRLLGDASNEAVVVGEDRLWITLRDGSDADLDAVADGRLSSSWQFAQADRAWTNPVEPLDVNGDGRVTPLDALNIINEVSRRGGSFLADGDRPADAGYFDVSKDGRVSPMDALRVINALVRGGNGEAIGEGEPPSQTSRVEEPRPVMAPLTDEEVVDHSNFRDDVSWGVERPTWNRRRG